MSRLVWAGELCGGAAGKGDRDPEGIGGFGRGHCGVIVAGVDRACAGRGGGGVAGSVVAGALVVGRFRVSDDDRGVDVRGGCGVGGGDCAGDGGGAGAACGEGESGGKSSGIAGPLMAVNSHKSITVCIPFAFWPIRWYFCLVAAQAKRMKKILLVEDDPQITSLLRLHLHEPFYAVTPCDRAAAAMEKLSGMTYDLVILDIMLPDGNGIDLCRVIRGQNERTPILMLSSLAEETDKVTALELGADDYLTKPFGVFELMARVKALMRRGSQGGQSTGGDGEESEKGVILRGELVIDRDS